VELMARSEPVEAGCQAKERVSGSILDHLLSRLVLSAPKGNMSFQFRSNVYVHICI
jgi:hypothetical protein